MKKGIIKRKFHREKAQREAMCNSLMEALFSKERIKTTEAKAKELKRLSEKMLTRAKKGDLASRRILLKSLHPKVVKKLVDQVAPKYKERKGGYTRVIKLGPRPSDGSKMAYIELV